jgi:hypothetical protein
MYKFTLGDLFEGIMKEIPITIWYSARNAAVSGRRETAAYNATGS